VADLVVSYVDVLYLTLVWGCNLALTSNGFNARPVVNVFCRKLLDDNIYKQFELRGSNGY
jgi:hypothetical protein